MRTDSPAALTVGLPRADDDFPVSLSSEVLQARYRSKAELVSEMLRETILTGELEPGQRIVVDSLADKLRISKIPIREALSQLAAEGLVVLISHVGAYVASPLTAQELADIYAIRANLEEMAASLAAKKATADQLRQLQRVNEEVAARANELDRTGWSCLNRQFHLTIAAASGNPLLAQLCEEVLNRSARYRGKPDANRWHRLAEEHQRIAEAIARHDPELAGSLARAHLERAIREEVPLAPQADPGCPLEGSSKQDP